MKRAILLVLLVLLLAATFALPATAKGSVPRADDPGGGGGSCVKCILCCIPGQGNCTNVCGTGSTCGSIHLSCPSIPPPFFYVVVGSSCGCN